jgi:hypothetical protein
LWKWISETIDFQVPAGEACKMPDTHCKMPGIILETYTIRPVLHLSVDDQAMPVT